MKNFCERLFQRLEIVLLSDENGLGGDGLIAN